MKMRNMKRKGFSPYGYILPIGLILGLFVVGSILVSIGLGFTKYNILTEPEFVGLKNYVRLASDAKFLKALKNTLGLIVIIVPLQTVSGILVAVFLTVNRKRPLGRLANWAVFIPVVCADAVAGVVWRELLNGKMKVVEGFFGVFGIEPSKLLGSVDTALLTVGVIAVWKYMGYFVVIYSSGLLGISDTYYEAAKADGAGKLHCFLHITLPMLKPTVILGIFLSVTHAIRCFDLIYNLTGGGPNNATTTLTIYIYQTSFGSSRAGYAMALSNALFVVVLVIALVQRKWMHRDISEI